MAEDISCIFCNIDNKQVFIEENGYLGRKCPRCALIYISPRPTFSEILNIYGHDQAYVSAEDHIANEFLKRLYARHNLSLIKKYVEHGALLEIGAGAGYFLDEAKKCSFKAYGIEPNPIQADFINKTLTIPCETTPLNAASFSDQKFDVIYHCDVLSHFYDPIAEFKEINKKLVTGGLCVFETGNFSDVEQKYLATIESFHYPTHLFFFGENNLKNLLALSGFKLEKMHNYSIMAERFTEKALKGLFRQLKTIIRGKKTDSSKTVAVPESLVNNQVTGQSSLRRLRQALFKYFIYFARYRIGSIIPKKGRPQTIIVIARKVSSAE